MQAAKPATMTTLTMTMTFTREAPVTLSPPSLIQPMKGTTAKTTATITATTTTETTMTMVTTAAPTTTTATTTTMVTTAAPTTMTTTTVTTTTATTTMVTTTTATTMTTATTTAASTRTAQKKSRSLTMTFTRETPATLSPPSLIQPMKGMVMTAETKAGKPGATMTGGARTLDPTVFTREKLLFTISRTRSPTTRQYIRESFRIRKGLREDVLSLIHHIATVSGRSLARTRVDDRVRTQSISLVSWTSIC
ncbi:uncharacterized protein F5147DRAFT_333351 [Suillus discolor]|uniref:Uncharacterized protein n=1 Tax=Suillus discolor TaxID=1912936 RepID=A0A9P7F1L2_9AGAM|nr:uncharacterized protein F5147DRAFT_333351 [Suillus discolor]KAG2099886.1 hypothetical protein F5147DRAFT_333351 [Suillus discolor]